MSVTGVKSINATVEIARSPDEVFGYLADPVRLTEWQPDVRRAAFDQPAVVGVGARGHEVRHVMGADRSIAWEVTDYDPGHRYGVRGVDGPVRARIKVGLAPTVDGTGTQLDYNIDFEGHGIGRLLAPVARNGVRKDLGSTLARLKQRLEESPR